MLLISIWHGAWEQRKGCLSSVSKKEKLESFLSSVNVTWTMSSSVFSVPASSWCLGHEQSFATQISEGPLFWCALVVPGGVKTWLSCLPKPVGFLFCRSEILAYAKFPWESSLWLQQDLAPGRKTCWKAPSCLAAHLCSGSYWEGGEDKVPWFKIIEGKDAPKWGTSTLSFNHSHFASKERWMGVDLSEKITRQNILTKSHTFLIEESQVIFQLFSS